MLLTAILAGGAFCALFIMHGTLLAPLVAHMTLNIIEYAYTAWKNCG